MSRGVKIGKSKMRHLVGYHRSFINFSQPEQNYDLKFGMHKLIYCSYLYIKLYLSCRNKEARAWRQTMKLCFHLVTRKKFLEKLKFLIIRFQFFYRVCNYSSFLSYFWVEWDYSLCLSPYLNPDFVELKVMKAAPDFALFTSDILFHHSIKLYREKSQIGFILFKAEHYLGYKTVIVNGPHLCTAPAEMGLNVSHRPNFITIFQLYVKQNTEICLFENAVYWHCIVTEKSSIFLWILHSFIFNLMYSVICPGRNLTRIRTIS